MRDHFASWLVGLRVTRWLAWRGFMSCHLIPLCLAHAFGVPVRWRHLTRKAAVSYAGGRHA